MPRLSAVGISGIYAGEDVNADITSTLFWLHADQVGFHVAAKDVLQSNGRCLLEQSFSHNVLASYGVTRLPEAGQEATGRAVAKEAEGSVYRGENLIGMVEMQDAETGRSHSAKTLDTQPLQACLPKWVNSKTPIEKIGRLCLRRPKPSVVFAEKPPQSRLIQIADTQQALGYQYPIFMADILAQPFGLNLYLLQGRLLIPCPHAQAASQWQKFIANAVHFQFRLEVPNGAGGNNTIEAGY